MGPGVFLTNELCCFYSYPCYYDKILTYLHTYLLTYLLTYNKFQPPVEVSGSLP